MRRLVPLVISRLPLLPVALLPLGLLQQAHAQEASSGFELRTTLSAEAFASDELSEEPRNGSPVSGGFRAMLYPVWKWNDQWSFEGTFQIHSEPYFFDEFHNSGYSVRTDVLQAHLNYAHFWKKASVVVRAGMLSSAFGSFLLRYDDMINPLIDKPLSYGYYGGINPQGLAGIQADVTYGKFDVRVQFANSSPLNRRAIYDRDQYGNWAGGAGYTIKQGFRVGASLLRGPYLSRNYAYFWPDEAPPNTLPATGVGVDVSWGHGPWTVYGEWQRFQLDYHAIPTVREQFAYGEVRRVLNPRWFLAARQGRMTASYGSSTNVFEAGLGFRPNAFELIKLEYETNKTVAIQFVTSFQPLAIAGH